MLLKNIFVLRLYVASNIIIGKNINKQISYGKLNNSIPKSHYAEQNITETIIAIITSKMLFGIYYYNLLP